MCCNLILGLSESLATTSPRDEIVISKVRSVVVQANTSLDCTFDQKSFAKQRLPLAFSLVCNVGLVPSYREACEH